MPYIFDNPHAIKFFLILQYYFFLATSCKARWNNIRDNFRRSLKKTKTRGKAKKVRPYKYSEQLNFLNQYFDEKETKGNIEEEKEEEEMQNIEGHDETEIKDNQDDERKPSVMKSLQDLQNQSSSTMNNKNTSEVPTKLTKRKLVPLAPKNVVPQQTASSKVMGYLINKNENLATATSQHPVDAFLAGIAPTLKTLSSYYLHLAKSEIFATVQKYELKLLTEQQSYQGKFDQNLTHNRTAQSTYSKTPSSVSVPILLSTGSSSSTTFSNSNDSALQN